LFLNESIPHFHDFSSVFSKKVRRRFEVKIALRLENPRFYTFLKIVKIADGLFALFLPYFCLFFSKKVLQMAILRGFSRRTFLDNITVIFYQSDFLLA
jgi:hypothetical protein